MEKTVQNKIQKHDPINEIHVWHFPSISQYLALTLSLSSPAGSLPLSPLDAIINTANANRVALKLACGVCRRGNRAKHTAPTKPLIYSRRGFAAAEHTHTHTHIHACSHALEPACQTDNREVEKDCKWLNLMAARCIWVCEWDRKRVTRGTSAFLHFYMHVCVVCVHAYMVYSKLVRVQAPVHFLFLCTLRPHVHLFVCMCVCVHVVPFNPFLWVWHHLTCGPLQWDSS